MELQVGFGWTKRVADVATAILAVFFVALIIGVPASAAAVPGGDVLYTSNADFDKGTLVNVNHDDVPDQLQLNKDTSTFPFVWVSLSVRCTIAKIDTRSGEILGEFRTISDEAKVGCNQSSRTTVALDGSVWVGHRGPGGATHVGLRELNGCVDRNGNGSIDTSTGYGDVKPWDGMTSLVADAQDECIIHHADTDGLGFRDTRHMSVDANNKLWIGDFGSRQFVRVNGSTGAFETTPRAMSCGGYGGLIDGDGIIWSASGGGSVLRWDPDAPDSSTNPRCITVENYGMAVDKDGSIFTSPFSTNVFKISPDGNTIEGPFPHGGNGAQGLAVDSTGDVWISSSIGCSSGCSVGHLKNDGTFVGRVPNPTGAGSTGVAVDAAGKIWTANLFSNTATRIDPSGGPIGADGVTRVGAVDLTVDFPAGPDGRPSPQPYNYSDMTGAQLLSSTSPQGTWTVVQDGGTTGHSWNKIVLSGSTPGSRAGRAASSITIEARAADDEAGLGGQTYKTFASGQLLNLSGRFIDVRVTLRPATDGASPIVTDVRVCDTDGCKPAAAPPPTASQPAAAVLGAQRKSCVSRRNFSIRVRRPGGRKIRKAVVSVNGKRVKVVRGARLRSRVNLRGLPKGRFTVRIVVTTVDGKRFTGTRRYRTCVKRRPGDGPPRI